MTVSQTTAPDDPEYEWTENVGKTTSQAVNGLLSGVRWQSQSITYAIPNSSLDYGDPDTYFNDEDGDGKSVQSEGFSPLNAKQEIALHFALNANDLGQGKAGAGFSVEGFTNLKVSYAGDGAADATIRAANTSDYAGAYAFFPDPSEYGGDAWFGPSCLDSQAGNFAWMVFLHELGHALGLKHAHEASDYGAVPANKDSLEFTLMTYRTFIGDKPGPGSFEKWGAPQTYMMLDIAALQHMYGADFSTNSGNTTYSWNPAAGTTYVNGAAAITPGGNRIFLTVWDGGGIDTYDLSAYADGVRVSLAPGSFSVLSQEQLADLGGGPNNGHARGSVFNALLYKGDTRSLIENAKGGGGNDVIKGNIADNRLEGGGGRDQLWGYAGEDTLVGGDGRDALHGGSGSDALRGFSGNDRLSGGEGADRLVGGTGSDVFVFRDTDESQPGSMDRILGGDGSVAFQGAGPGGGDRIDVSAIDANPGSAGDQAFKWGGTTKAGTGYLYVKEVSGDTHIYGNVDTGKAPEFALKILDGSVLAAAYSIDDFIL